ncbi:hypothetical protein EZY14_004230 [Kordia sp. TARA_039_SRF]|nr:hypothetical protein EZY14_004230 [Kordia sp. TARA_039_SRF]
MKFLNLRKKRRSKNRLKNNNSIIANISFFVLIIYSIKSAFDKKSFLGPLPLVLLVIMIFIAFLHSYKFIKFHRYADKFENNDPWLPKNFEIKLPPTLQKIVDRSADDVRKEMGIKNYIKALEAELEFLHEHKRKIEKKQKEWETVPIPKDELFWKVETRMNLSDRTAIYSADERAFFQREFIRLIDDQENLIAKINKLLNRAIDKGSEIPRGNFDISNIDGLNS